MKLQFANQKVHGFTLIDLLVVIAVFAVFFALIDWGAPVSAKRKAQRINCICNLKQIGIAYRIWEGDHSDKYPMAVSVTNGGVMELVASGDVVACFQVMSNQLSTPKILWCPAEVRWLMATNFSNLQNSNISYFVGLDAAEIYPQMILDGDDNLIVHGERVKPGVLSLETNIAIAWGKDRHNHCGNLGMADGSVQQATALGLKEALIQAGVATNRLVLP